MRKALLVLSLALAASPLRASMAPAEVSGLTFNTQLLLEMYNVASQNNNVISSYPANLDPGVVTARLSNPANAQPGPVYMRVLINEHGSNCGTVVTGPLLKTKDAIAPGSNVMLNANSFEVEGSYNGTLCPEFEAEMKSKFENADLNKLKDAVSQFMKRRFEVCLVVTDAAGNPIGNSACTDLEIFTANPGAKASCAVLIYPHNNGIPNGFPNFLWTPAIYPGAMGSDIAYTLEVMEDGSNEPFARVDVGGGATFYQWGANDRTLMPGRKYQWRVVSKLASNGQPIGGQSGQGWNVQKWFQVAAAQGQGVDDGPCSYTLEQLADFVKTQSTAPEVNAALKDFKISRVVSRQGLNDPAICRLLKDKKNFLGVVVVKR